MKGIIPHFLYPVAVSAFLLLFAFSAQAQGNGGKLAYRGFSGGMMLHTGYVQSSNFSLHSADGAMTRNMKLGGMAAGIGGSARLHFGEHLRIGAEGYSSGYSYDNQSFVTIGWGGVLADYAVETGRFTSFAGGTFGGGSQKNLSILEVPEDGYEGFELDEQMSFRRFGFLCLTPFAGIEFALNSKIHLVLKVDYIINLSNQQADFVTGSRIYLGFMFCR